jgi:hypothetical protein
MNSKDGPSKKDQNIPWLVGPSASQILVAAMAGTQRPTPRRASTMPLGGQPQDVAVAEPLGNQPKVVAAISSGGMGRQARAAQVPAPSTTSTSHQAARVVASNNNSTWPGSSQPLSPEISINDDGWFMVQRRSDGGLWWGAHRRRVEDASTRAVRSIRPEWHVARTALEISVRVELVARQWQAAAALGHVDGKLVILSRHGAPSRRSAAARPRTVAC